MKTLDLVSKIANKHLIDQIFAKSSELTIHIFDHQPELKLTVYKCNGNSKLEFNIITLYASRANVHLIINYIHMNDSQNRDCMRNLCNLLITFDLP